MRSPLLPIGLKRDVLPIGLLFSRAPVIPISSCPPTLSAFIVGYPSAVSALESQPAIASSAQSAELMAAWLVEPAIAASTGYAGLVAVLLEEQAIAAVLNSAPSIEVACKDA